MSSPVTIVLPFIFVFLTCDQIQIPTAYQVLQEYDFQVGLLPRNVISYTLNRETGEFQVNLGTKCAFSTDGYDLKFRSTLSGVISKDRLRNLKGVSVKLMFIWMEIIEATRDEDELDVSVGMLSAGFDVEAFEVSPECGCGFDCDDLRMTGDVTLTKMLDWAL